MQGALEVLLRRPDPEIPKICQSWIRVFVVAHSQAAGTLGGTVRFEKHKCINIDGEITIKIISALQDIVGLVGNHVSL